MPKSRVNLANLITIVRAILVFVVVILVVYGKEYNSAYIAAFILTALIIYMDGLDGYVARKYNYASKFGAVLDIIGDRIVENVYWITFVYLGWVSVWIPLIVITRGLVVDGIRSLAFEQGMTAFGKTTMMKSAIGKFLVASNFSRFSYAAFKAIAFSLLIVANMPDWDPNLLKSIITVVANISVYITVFFCVVRGIPVIIEGKSLFKEPGEEHIEEDSSENTIPPVGREATNVN